MLLRLDRSRQSVSEQLNDLLADRLVDFVVLPQSHRTQVWYLTPKGACLTRDWPALRGRPPYPIASATAASLKTPHTLTVLRGHLRFVADSRRRDDEHGHLDWTPKALQSIGDGERIVADTVMHYTLIEGEQRRKLLAFVEVDRSTMSSVRLAARTRGYGRTNRSPSVGAGRLAPRGGCAATPWSPGSWSC